MREAVGFEEEGPLSGALAELDATGLDDIDEHLFQLADGALGAVPAIGRWIFRRHNGGSLLPALISIPDFGPSLSWSAVMRHDLCCRRLTRGSSVRTTLGSRIGGPPAQTTFHGERVGGGERPEPRTDKSPSTPRPRNARMVSHYPRPHGVSSEKHEMASPCKPVLPPVPVDSRLTRPASADAIRTREDGSKPPVGPSATVPSASQLDSTIHNDQSGRAGFSHRYVPMPRQNEIEQLFCLIYDGPQNSQTQDETRLRQNAVPHPGGVEAPLCRDKRQA